MRCCCCRSWCSPPCCSTAPWSTPVNGLSCSRTWRTWAVFCWWLIRTRPETKDVPEPENFRGTLRRSRKQGEYPQVCAILQRSVGIIRELQGADFETRIMRMTCDLIRFSLSPFEVLIVWPTWFSGLRAAAGLI